MSAKVDKERAEDARARRAIKARSEQYRRDRVIDLWEDWLTDRQIAAQLGVSARTIRRDRKYMRLGDYKPTAKSPRLAVTADGARVLGQPERHRHVRGLAHQHARNTP